MKRVAIITSDGIGDALLMMIAAHKFYEAGYLVTLFHPKIHQLADWFKEYTFDSLDKDIEKLEIFDLVILQHPSKVFDTLIEHRKKGKLPQMMVFYPHYHEDFGLIQPQDYIFDKNLLMTENIDKATCHILPGATSSLDNGIRIPKDLNLTHRKKKNRVLIHPSSALLVKNWPKKKFIKLGKRLKNAGFDVNFILSPEERSAFEEIYSLGFKAPEFSTLSQLASYVYESGFLIGNDSLLGHLASLLNIPTLIIARCKRHMKMWRPGWKRGDVVVPPKWAPNLKFLRLREKYWKRFISVSMVWHRFSKLLVSEAKRDI